MLAIGLVIATTVGSRRGHALVPACHGDRVRARAIVSPPTRRATAVMQGCACRRGWSPSRGEKPGQRRDRPVAFQLRWARSQRRFFAVAPLARFAIVALAGSVRPGRGLDRRAGPPAARRLLIETVINRDHGVRRVHPGEHLGSRACRHRVGGGSSLRNPRCSRAPRMRSAACGACCCSCFNSLVFILIGLELADEHPARHAVDQRCDRLVPAVAGATIGFAVVGADVMYLPYRIRACSGDRRRRSGRAVVVSWTRCAASCRSPSRWRCPGRLPTARVAVSRLLILLCSRSSS